MPDEKSSIPDGMEFHSPDALDKSSLSAVRELRIEKEKARRMYNKQAAAMTAYVEAERDRVEKESRSTLDASHGIVVEESGLPNVTRDILWVYEHLSRLFGKDKNGRPCINEEMLRQAPSNGAVLLAARAHRDPDYFVDNYVLGRVVQKEKIARDGSADAVTSEASAEELDPGLTEIEKYMK